LFIKHGITDTGTMKGLGSLYFSCSFYIGGDWDSEQITGRPSSPKIWTLAMRSPCCLWQSQVVDRDHNSWLSSTVHLQEVNVFQVLMGAQVAISFSAFANFFSFPCGLFRLPGALVHTWGSFQGIWQETWRYSWVWGSLPWGLWPSLHTSKVVLYPWATFVMVQAWHTSVAMRHQDFLSDNWCNWWKTLSFSKCPSMPK
jgi:hypothetical protein